MNVSKKLGRRRSKTTLPALSWVSLVSLVCLAVSLAAMGGCRTDLVGGDLARVASDCNAAAAIFFGMRSMAGDYSSDEAQRLSDVTEAELKACGPASLKADCLRAGARVKARISGRVAICNTFFEALQEAH